MEYLLHIATLIALYCILASSLNLVMGYTGILSLSHAAFYGIGAYTAALLALHWNVALPISIVVAMLVAGVIGCGVSIPLVRLKGDGVVVGTFAFQILVTSVLTNSQYTGGASGLPGIPPAQVFGWQLDGVAGLCATAWCLGLASVLFARHLVRTPLGRVLESIREDEVLVAVTGRNVARVKATVFTIGGMIAACAGAFYAHYIGFVDPTSFSLTDSIFIASIVIIGGAGSTWGPIVGAAILVALPELLRMLGLPASAAAHVREVVYGGALVGIIAWKPSGLLGTYSFGEESR